MTRCAVPNCSEIGNHVFPTDIKIKRLWIKAIRRPKFEPTKYSRLCRKHFLESDYQHASKDTGLEHQHKYLNKKAVPSVFSWNTNKPAIQAEARKSRLQARNARKKLFQDQPSVSFVNQGVLHISEEVQNMSHEVEIITTEATNSDNLADVVPNVVATQTPNMLRLFSTEMLLSDDEMVKYYTGLESVSKFNFVLSTVLPMAHNIKYRWSKVLGLSVEDQFLILLIKLRQNRPDFELAKMFGVSKTEISNIVVTWINFVNNLWELIDIWPSRELVNFYMPDSFRKHYKSTRVIIDGTEIPIQKPSHPDSQKATFSSYKHRNTLKFLVGASPGGLLTLSSGAYAGSVSDRQIVERSSLLQLCDKGDSIMADRGFNVQDIFACKEIGINIPSFLKGRSQIPGILLKEDLKLSSQRVHIERLIGFTKTYKILTHELNQFYVPLASKIFFICMMLCNFRECIMNKRK